MNPSEAALLRNSRSVSDDGPVFEINKPEGTFKLEIVGGKLVTSGSLQPSAAASVFFEEVGRHVLDYLRANRN